MKPFFYIEKKNTFRDLLTQAFYFMATLYMYWYRILSVLDLCARSQKIWIYHFLSMGPWEHPEWHSTTRSDTRVTKVPFLTKMTKISLVNLGLTEGQTMSKSIQNNTFHSFSSNLSFSDIFSHFDQVWPEVDFGWAEKP